MKLKKIFNISTIIVIIDQIIKFLITANFNVDEGVLLIPVFFSIVRVHNTGAAWSIMSENTLILILLSLVALVAIYFFFIKNNKLGKIESITIGVLIGGILGNLIDRVFRGYVVDYLFFQIFEYNFPVFNFADICIVISAIVLLFLQLRGSRENENNKNQ